jgi:hypothetical protein
VRLLTPFLRRLITAAALTAAVLALLPTVSDFGHYPHDGARALLALVVTFFALSYLSVLAITVALRLLPGRRTSLQQ